MVRLLVNPVPNIADVAVSSCSGNVFTTPVTGDVTGTLYTWTAPTQVSGGVITGGSAVAVGQYFVGQALSNNGTQGVVDYTVTPNANGCIGANFKVTVTVIAAGTKAQLNNLAPPAICTGNTFNYPGSSNAAVTSYTWTRYPTNGITPSTNNGTGNNPFEPLTNTSNIPLKANYAFTLATADGCTNTQLVPVTVNPVANLSSSLSPLPICSNTAFSYTPLSSTPLTVFSWSRAAVPGISNSAASGTGNPNEVLINTTTNPIIVSYVYTLTPPTGCVSTQTVIVTVNPAPLLTSTLTPPAICSGATFTYAPTSSTSGITFNWSRSELASISNGAGAGVGNPAEILVNMSNNAVTVTYAYSLLANGCTSIQNVNVIVNPTPNITNLTAASCSNSSFTVTPPNVPAGTQYTWTIPVINPAGSITGGSLKNTLQNSISQTLTNATGNPAIATYTVIPVANGCAGTAFTVDVTVNNLPTLTSSVTPPAICSNTAFNYTPTSALAGTSFSWTRTAISGINNGTANGINNPNETLVNTNASSVSVIYQYVLTSATGCVSPVQNVTVQVNPAASLSSNLTPPAICSGASFSYIPSSVTVGTVFNWTRDIQTSISNGASSGIGNPAEILINTGTTPATVNYVYSLTANGCTNTQVVSVAVNPTPSVPAQLSSICSGTAFTINPKVVPAGTQYTWAAPVINPVLSLQGGASQAVLQNLVSQTLTNITNNIATATYSVIPTANGCIGSSFNIAVTVNPAPVLTSNASPAAVCSNAVFSYNPLSSITGTSFAWTRAAVAGISNGASSGINNPNETLINKTNSAVSVIYQYILTSPSGCVSSVQNVTVQVNPSPVLSSNVTPPAICSGSIFNYTPLSATIGTGFTWTRDQQTSISNIASSGSGNPAETLINTGITSANVVYIYTLTANGCSNTQTVSVAVNPTPVIPSQLSSVCTGNSFAINPSGVPAGTQYTWTAPVLNPVLSLNGSSSQAVLQNSIGQTLTNNTNSSATATYTVTPSANGCTGNSFSLVVTVNPIPALSSTLTPNAICSNTNFNYTPTSLLPGNSFLWTRASVAGISNSAASGNNNPNETLINLSGNAVSIVYSYIITTPNGCINTQLVTVLVNPLPVLNNTTPAAICSGAVFNYTPVSSIAGSVFSWSRLQNNFISNIASSGTGNPAEVLVNTSTNAVNVTYNYTITSPVGCVNTQSVILPVNPSPIINNLNVIACNNTSFTVNPSNVPAGTVYTWSLPTYSPVGSVLGGTSQSVAQSSIIQTLINQTLNPAVATYTVVPSSNGCTGSSFSMAVTVSNTTVLSSNLSAPAICSNALFNYLPTSNTSGTSFAWTRSVVNGISNPASSGTGNPGETLINITTQPILVSYNYTLNTTNGCLNTQTVTVVVNPTPVLSSTLAPPAICSGAAFNYTPASVFAGASYSWSRTVMPFISNGAGSGSGNINPSEVLVNTTVNPVTVPYNYIITSNGCSNTQTVNVIVNPTPNVSNQVTTICGSTSFAVNPINVPVGTQYTWSAPSINPTGSINGGISQTVLQNTIGQLLTNQTLSTGIAIYTVTPVANGCTGVNFSVAVSVKPTPVIPSQQIAAVCSGTAFSFASANVPAGGTSYSWSSPVISPQGSLTGGSGQSLLQTSISQILSSTNNLTNTATYSVIPVTAGCVGNTFSLTVPVNPVPVVADLVDTICSGSTFSVVPGPVPANTTYTWSIPTSLPNGSLIGGKAQTTPVSVLSQSLQITGNNISKALYSITPSALGCAGNPFNLIETVGAPLAVIKNSTALICSGTSFDLTPLTVPANTTYTWAMPVDNPVGAASGYSAQGSRQIKISETLTNLISKPVTVVYTVVPFNTGCTGAPFTASVTISPVPKSTISGKQVVCRDPFDTLSVNFVGTAPWSFSYLDNGIAKNVTGIIASPFTWVLPSLPVAPTRTVEITLVNDRACVDSIDTVVFIQKVNPLPVGQIVSLHGNYICNNIPDTLFVSYPIGDTFKYLWTRNGVSIQGATVDSISTLSAGYYNAVLSNQFGCVDTASLPVTLSVIAQPKINFSYDSYCINNLIHFTNLTDTTLIGRTSWLWDLGDSTTSSNFHATDSYVKAGNRHIRLTATQVFCQAYNTSFDSTINIEFPISGIRLPSVSAYKGVFTPISDRNIPTYKYLWTPTRGIDFPDRPSVNFNFQATQEYLINLTSPAGCVTTDSVMVRVFDDKLVDIMVPKSFTPNGDGINDVLYPYLAGIKTFQYFKVYNRQGKLLFETTNPDAGWNGSYNGSPLPMGIYIWVTVGIAIDGTSIQKTGQTVLMR